MRPAPNAKHYVLAKTAPTKRGKALCLCRPAAGRRTGTTAALAAVTAIAVIAAIAAIAVRTAMAATEVIVAMVPIAVMAATAATTAITAIAAIAAVDGRYPAGTSAPAIFATRATEYPQ